MARPTVRIYERRRIPLPRPGKVDPFEGAFVEVSYETELKVGENENQATMRAMREMQAAVAGGAPVAAGTSLEERLKQVQAQFGARKSP